MKNTNLTKPTRIKQKLFLIFHGDGIMDLVSGLTILLLSAVMAFESGGFIGMIGIPYQNGMKMQILLKTQQPSQCWQNKKSLA